MVLEEEVEEVEARLHHAELVIAEERPQVALDERLITTSRQGIIGVSVSE